MAHIKRRMERMLFDYETTYRTDYRPTKLKEPVPTVYKPKGSCARIRPPPLKDIHTLCDWKTPGIPFNLVHKPRPHTGTDPTKVQKAYFAPVDKGIEHAIKTRPRRVMTPAVSMDDIENPSVRELLINDIYVSDMTKGLREAVKPYFKVVAPRPGLPANSNPITLPKLVQPYVSPEWRMDTVFWDNNQLRAHCDTTKNFWLSQPLPPCGACKQSHKIDARARQQCLAKPGRSLQRR